MATSVYPATGGMVGNTDAATFIPEIWSDEVIAAYEKSLGYALGKQVDDDLFTLGKSFGDGDGSNFVTSATFYNDVSTGTTAYAVDQVVVGDIFDDSFLRDMIQKMDDADTPMDGRSLVIPPAMRNAIMGVDRYVSSDFVNGQGVANGKIGELYGVDIYVSTNCPVLETASENSAGGAIRGALLCHKDTMVLAEQQGIRSQTQYKQEFLGTLYTADRLYGTQVLRPETGFIMAVNG